jgi:hypothetical protein
MRTYTCIKDKIFIFQGKINGQYDLKVGDVISCNFDGSFYIFPNGGKVYANIFLKYFI